MKKRTKLIVYLSALLAMVIGGATYAWFTSNPASVANTFNAGTVAVTLNDYQGTDVTNAFPAAGISNVNPGDWYDKNVSVTSSGSKGTYVRVKLTPAWDPPAVTLDKEQVILDPDDPAVLLDLGSDWQYSNGYYYYKHILTQGQTTTLLLSGVKFAGSEIDNKYQNATFTITAQAEAVQASHYAFRDVWGLGDTLTVPAAGVDPWTAVNEVPAS